MPPGAACKMLYQQRALWDEGFWEMLYPKTCQGETCEGQGVTQQRNLFPLEFPSAARI